MALRTAEQYLESLRDGRTVYYRGEILREAGLTEAEVAALRTKGVVR